MKLISQALCKQLLRGQLIMAAKSSWQNGKPMKQPIRAKGCLEGQIEPIKPVMKYLMILMSFGKYDYIQYRRP